MYALIALQLLTTPPLGTTYVAPPPLIPIQHYHTVPTGRIYYGGHAGETSGVFVPTPPRPVYTIPVPVYPRINTYDR